MKRKTQSDLQVEVFKALGHPVRVEILKAVADKEVPMQDLCRRLSIAQSNVSRHASLMRRCGILSERRAGPHIFLSLAARELLGSLDHAAQVQRRRLSQNQTMMVIKSRES